LQLAAFADGGDIDAFVEHGEIRIFFDLRGGYGTGLLNIYIDRFRQVGIQLDRHLLQVEDNVRGIYPPRRRSKKIRAARLRFHPR